MPARAFVRRQARHRSRARPGNRAGWRACVAWCALIALAWPSLGTLPWIVSGEIAAEAHVAAGQTARSAAAPTLEDHHHHDVDASDIPGSPTHPADHNCFQCEVLKHLSRCAPAHADPPTIAPLCGSPIQPRVLPASQHAGRVAFLPPVRAPPLRSV